MQEVFDKLEKLHAKVMANADSRQERMDKASKDLDVIEKNLVSSK